MKTATLRKEINRIFDEYILRRRSSKAATGKQQSMVDVEAVRFEVLRYLDALPEPEYIETTKGIKKFENFDSIPKIDAAVLSNENQYVIFTKAGYEARMERLRVLLSLTAAAAIKRINDNGAWKEPLAESVRWAMGTACQVVLGDEHAFEPDVKSEKWMDYVQEAMKKP